MKINGHYKLQNMSKLSLSQEYKVGLILENQSNSHADRLNEKNNMIISIDVFKKHLKFQHSFIIKSLI